MTRRASTIDRLPPEIRETIGTLLKQSRTLDEILAKLRELDVVNVSRSALGRHAKSFAEVAERMRVSKEIALAMTDKFGDQPDDKLAQMNLEILHSLVLETLMAAAGSKDEDGEALTLEPKQVKDLADALRSMNTAAKTNADRMLKMRAEFAKEAAAKVETGMKARGMSADTIEAIKHLVLGV